MRDEERSFDFVPRSQKTRESTARGTSLRMTILARSSKHAMLEERVDAREDFGGVEGRRAGGDAVRSERGLRGVRDWLLRERVRQRLECRLVLEREVNAFVGFDEDEDAAISILVHLQARVTLHLEYMLRVKLRIGRRLRRVVFRRAKATRFHRRRAAVRFRGNSRSLVARGGSGLARDDNIPIGRRR